MHSLTKQKLPIYTSHSIHSQVIASRRHLAWLCQNATVTYWLEYLCPYKQPTQQHALPIQITTSSTTDSLWPSLQHNLGKLVPDS